MKKRLALACCIIALLTLCCGAAQASRGSKNTYYVIVGLYDLSSDGLYSSCNNSLGYLIMPLMDQDGTLHDRTYCSPDIPWISHVQEGDWDTENGQFWYREEFQPYHNGRGYYSSETSARQNAFWTYGFPTELVCRKHKGNMGSLSASYDIDNGDPIENLNETYTSKIRFVVKVSTDKVHWTTIGDWTERTSRGGKWSDPKIIDPQYYPRAWRVDEVQGPYQVQIPTPDLLANIAQYSSILADQYGAEWYQPNDGVTYSLIDAPEGITISSTGELLVYNSVMDHVSAPGDFTIHIGSKGLDGTTYSKTVEILWPRNTVTYENYDGSVIASYTDILYGSAWAHNIAAPTRTPDANGHYVFSGWDCDYIGPNITKDTVFTAAYQCRPHSWVYNSSCSSRTCTECNYSEAYVNQQVNVTSGTTVWEGGNTYRVTQNVTIADRVECNGKPILQLDPGVTLTCAKGIFVRGGSTITIQGTGTLVADASSVVNAAGIGGTAPSGNNSNTGTIIINGGTITAKGGSGAPGIGTRDGGTIGGIQIHGGQVTAIGGAGCYDIGCGTDGSGSSITLGWTNINDYINAGGILAEHISLEDEFHYKVDGVDFGAATAGDIVGKVTAYVLTPWISPTGSGDGSVNSPWLIQSAADWNSLSEAVSIGIPYSGHHFRLTSDISVSTMVGTSATPFGGIFHGAAHTLNVNYTTTEAGAAPFRYIKDATIENLKTAGSISTSAKFAAGIVSVTKGACVITNCRSSVAIDSSVSGDGTHGGIVACVNDTGCSLTIEGCVFDGSITGSGTTLCGGVLGYGRGDTFIYNCVFDPSAFQPTNSATFARGTFSLQSCYYLTKLNNQGLQARAVIAGENVNIDFGQSTAAYSASNIAAYTTGLAYNNVFYAGSGETLQFTLSSEAPQGCAAQYTASAGTLTKLGITWTLTMANAETTIGVLFVPASGAGTESDPWLISSAALWDTVASSIEKGLDTNGKYFKLTSDITVSTMLGTQANPFAGTFDGGKKTLTFNVENTNSNKSIAPFSQTSGATIYDLHVAGEITGNRGRASGLIGENVNAVSYVTNCRVSLSVSGTYFIAGFLVGEGPGVHFTGCVFDGTISSSDKGGGFAGWSEESSGLSFTDCVFAPVSATFTNRSGTFCYDEYNSGTQTVTNCYYTATAGSLQGKPAYSVTAGTGVNIYFSGTGVTYDVSGITHYATGLKYGGTFYAGPADAVALGLIAAQWDGYDQTFAASAGTLALTDDVWTLTMASADAEISIQRTPNFATAPTVRLSYDSGSGGYNNQGPDKLFDGLDSTKWCCAFSGQSWVEFHTDLRVVPTAYALKTGGDTARYPGRNPISWKLLGRNSADDSWAVISQQSGNLQLPGENCVEVFFPLSGSASYTYYRLEISAVSNGSTMQLSDFGLIGTPVYGTPDFKLPSFMTAIEDEAFEGIAARIVDVPANCGSIGDYAFRGCANLQQIRIPAGCAIGTDAFDDCALVYVFTAAGSPAEAYCSTHTNCVFVEYAQD